MLVVDSQVHIRGADTPERPWPRRAAAQRLFRGADLSRSPIPYRQHATLFTEEIPWLSADDKDWMMGRAACEWLGRRI